MIRQRGFTLIELLVTIAIVAILASIAMASYRDQVVKSRRGAGAACLQQSAQAMERYYTTNMTYVDATAGACDAEVAANYAISFVADPTVRAYTLQAVPQGGQATSDTKCGTLTINQQGVRTESGTASNANDCW